MSESSLIVIVLPSLVYPYFKLDIEQDEISRQMTLFRARVLLSIGKILFS